MLNLKPGSKESITFERYASDRKKRQGETYFTREYLQNELSQKWRALLIDYKENLSANTKEAESEFIFSFQIKISYSGDDILDHGLYLRLADNDIKEYLNSIYTFGRLSYLWHIVKPDGYSGYDCFFIRDVLVSAAAYDLPTLQSYLIALPCKPKEGHLMIKMLAVGIYALIDENHEVRKDAIAQLTKAMQTKVLGKWDKAILSCIISVIKLNKTEFSSSLQIVLDLFKLQDFYGLWSLSFICLPAHTLYNFAYFAFKKAGLEPPEEPQHRYWDSELWQLVKNNEPKQYILDFQKVSPLLAKWVDELSAALDFTLLKHEQGFDDLVLPVKPPAFVIKTPTGLGEIDKYLTYTFKKIAICEALLKKGDNATFTDYKNELNRFDATLYFTERNASQILQENTETFAEHVTDFYAEAITCKFAMNQEDPISSLKQLSIYEGDDSQAKLLNEISEQLGGPKMNINEYKQAAERVLKNLEKVA